MAPALWGPDGFVPSGPLLRGCHVLCGRSFFNGPGPPIALTGAIAPDSPLSHKSFNLTCAGIDLAA